MPAHRAFERLYRGYIRRTACRCAMKPYRWAMTYERISFPATDRVRWACPDCAQAVAECYCDNVEPLRPALVPKALVRARRVVAWVGYQQNVNTINVHGDVLDNLCLVQLRECAESTVSALFSTAGAAADTERDDLVNIAAETILVYLPGSALNGLVKDVRAEYIRKRFKNPRRGLWFQDEPFEGEVQRIVRVAVGTHVIDDEGAHLSNEQWHWLYGCWHGREVALIHPGDVEL